MTTWLLLFSPIGNFQMLLTFPMVWSRVVYLHLSCSNFTSHICSPMLSGTLTMKCIWGTGLMDHCLTLDIWVKDQDTWENVSGSTICWWLCPDGTQSLATSSSWTSLWKPLICLTFDLTISVGKTEVLLQPTPGSAAVSPSISIEGTTLKTVDFKYLGSIICSDGSLDKDISARICKANLALGYLHTYALNQHNTWQSTKLKVYKATVLTSLFYGCETWTLCRKYLKLLEYFHIQSLRPILKIRWQDRVMILEVLDRAETTSIEAMILKAQLQWTGHVIKMDN